MICAQQSSIAQDTVVVNPPVRKGFKPTPMKATMLAAAFPGFGQIYNRKYWKIPLVYAGFAGFGYAAVFNSGLHRKYTKAYQDFTDNSPETTSYTGVLPNTDPETYDPVLHPAQAAWVKDQMLARIDYYKNYRDLSYIGIVGWYILSIIDANVDASLFDYDIGENLNLALAPIQMPVNNFSCIGVNISLIISF
jgi:hypothetical protein